MRRCAWRATALGLALALVLGGAPPARAVVVEGAFQGFLDTGINSPFAGATVAGTLRYDTDTPTVLSQTPTSGRYDFTEPGSAALAVTYSLAGVVLGQFEIDAPSIEILVTGGLDAPGRPHDTNFIVQASQGGLFFMLYINQTGVLVLPGGSLPTATFPIGPDTAFSGDDISDPNNVVRFGSAHLLALTLATVPEPRPPLAVFGGALLSILWLRRRNGSGSRDATIAQPRV
jgi:hypothetical protein